MSEPEKLEACSIESLHAALDKIHRRACDGPSAPSYMSVPADPRRDADLMLSLAIDELSALRAEVAKLQAEVERLRMVLLNLTREASAAMQRRSCTDSMSHALSLARAEFHIPTPQEPT